MYWKLMLTAVLAGLGGLLVGRYWKSSHDEPRGRLGGGHSPRPEIRESSLDNLFRSVTYLTAPCPVAALFCQ